MEQKKEKSVNNDRQRLPPLRRSSVDYTGLSKSPMPPKRKKKNPGSPLLVHVEQGKNGDIFVKEQHTTNHSALKGQHLRHLEGLGAAR